MHPTSAELRTHMAARSRAELEAIVSSTSDDYTPEAVAAARDELATRPADAEPSTTPTWRGWTIGESLRALAALVLIWFAWGFLLIVFFGAISLNIESTLFGLVCLAVSLVLLWIARRLSTEALRLFTVIPFVLGIIWVARSLFGTNKLAPISAAFYLTAAAATVIIRRIRDGRAASANADPIIS